MKRDHAGCALEDGDIRRRDGELAERPRERGADEQRQRRFAAAIGVDDERLIAALRQAGLDEHTAALVETVPPLYIAWADGCVSGPERRAIDRLPRSDDVKATGRLGRRVLATWLDQRPPEAFFTAALAALRARLEQLDTEARTRVCNRLFTHATLVAAASGGLLGFGARSDAESQCIRVLEATLSVNNEKEQRR